MDGPFIKINQLISATLFKEEDFEVVVPVLSCKIIWIFILNSAHVNREFLFGKRMDGKRR